MVVQERAKPKRRPYVKVDTGPREDLSSVVRRMASSNEFAGVMLMAAWTFCLAFITFF